MCEVAKLLYVRDKTHTHTHTLIHQCLKEDSNAMSYCWSTAQLCEFHVDMLL
jgi:hypothetical protein